MKLPENLIGRNQDVEAIRRLAETGACVSLVGISNLGKSALMRQLTQSPSQGTFVYVDCNQMPERTGRALFVAIWHALSARLSTSELRAGAQHLYESMVAAPSNMTAALNFEAGLAFAFEHLATPLVFCLDDFDEAYRDLEPQTFLNLRAYKDQFGARLAYVTATERELARLPQSREQGEFLELVAPHTHMMHFLQLTESRAFCDFVAAREKVSFSDTDIEFIHANADGHPGLIQAVCYVLTQVAGASKPGKQQERIIHQLVQQNLADDVNVQSECKKIWDDLDPEEHAALLNFDAADAASPAQRRLRAKFIVRADAEDAKIFCRLFADFVRRVKITQAHKASGVYIDGGDVWVDGNRIEALTDLEYRLLEFLYGKMDRVCDKYSIVENVWGQQFIDEVDDARIEKLVSRVRQKIEPDAAHPRYLVSLRGRGYKLTR